MNISEEDTRGRMQKANASDVIQDVPDRDLAMLEASCSEQQTFKHVANIDANEQEALVEHVSDTSSSYPRQIRKLNSGDDIKVSRATCQEDKRPYATSSSSQMPTAGTCGRSGSALAKMAFRLRAPPRLHVSYCSSCYHSSLSPVLYNSRRCHLGSQR